MAWLTGMWEVTPAFPFLNLDPIAHLVGWSNEAPVIVDGQKVTALIDSGGQISSASYEFCEQIALKVYPLDWLLELEGTRGSAIPYLGYVEANLQIPGIRGYNKDILLLVIPITAYSVKVLVMVGYKIIDRVMGVIMKGELGGQLWPVNRPTLVWLCLGHSSWPTKAQGDGGAERGDNSSVAPAPTAPKEFYLDIQGHICTTQRVNTSPYLGPQIFITRQTFEGTVCEAMFWLSQHKAPNCPPPLYWLPYMGSYTQVPPRCQFKEAGCPPFSNPCQGGSW